VSAAPLAGRLALARSATDRLADRRGDAQWLATVRADPATRVMVVSAGRTLATDEGVWWTSPQDAPDGTQYLLGADEEGTVYLAVDVPDVEQVSAGLAAGGDAAGLRELGARLSDREAGLVVLAVALSNWHATHVRCPRCGAPTAVELAGFVRRCTVDGSEHYPRTDPAVIMLITDAAGDRALLGSSPRWPGQRYSTLAGFVEPGESAEAAVIREVAEESGVVVEDVTYLGSQPWPFPSSLMLGFTGRASPDSPEPAADGVELADVRWFSRAELAGQMESGAVRVPPSISIARRLIEHWYGGDLPRAAAPDW
jgi:NAD+ diphosphatase